MNSPEAQPEQTLQPRARGQRLVALDAARGFALLGIVLVNVDFFAVPVGLIESGGPFEPGVLPLAAWVFVALFCTGKFYPLFSLLFGMGISLQRRNVVERGGRYVPLGSSRMAILLAIGVLHVVLLWYGDILVFYATAGFAAVLMSGVAWRWRLALGVSLVVFSALTLALVTWLVPGEKVDVLALRAAAEQQPAIDRPFNQMIERIDQLDDDVTDPFFLAAETSAYRDGGFLQALGFRAFTYASIVAVGFLSLWWAILGLFLVGGALFDWGLFDKGRESSLMRFVGLAMGVGLPASALAVVLMRRGEHSPLADAFVYAGPMLFGPIMGLGYLSAIALLVRYGFARKAMSGLADAGRMALTNYLVQSLVLCFCFYHWGLGMFGQMPGEQRVLLAAGLFVAQLVLSQWWMSRFRFGPAEWLWRVLTYRRLQPMVR